MSLSATHLMEASAKRRTGGYRPFGIAELLVALAALSPICAVSGMMLAQILGLAPY